MFRTKRPRCAACTRAKRKCALSSSDSLSCEACLKRGVECVIDAVKIINYKGPSKSAKDASRKENSEVLSTVKSSSLLEMLTDAADQHERSADEFLFCLHPKVYLPRQSIKPGSIPMLIDETEERNFDEEVSIPKNFSLSDFVLSSLRVRSVKNSMFQNKPPVIPSTDTSGEKKIGSVLEKNGYEIKQPQSPPQPAPQVFQTFADIQLTINTETLSTEYYVKEAGVELGDNQQIKIVNINPLITQKMAEKLFNRFCEIQMDTLAQKLDRDMVPSLQICLPLVFGNVTVMEAAMVLAYYCHPPDEEIRSAIETLHLSIYNELQARMGHSTSLCCDHTLLLLVLLLEIELIKGGSTPLFQHVLSITHTLITFRGGAKRLTNTLTGLCLFKLLAPLLGNTNHHSVTSSHMDHKGMVSWVSFQSFLRTPTQIEVFDNVLLVPTATPKDLRDVVLVYAHINQLQNLLIVAYSANCDFVEGGELGFSGSYDGLAGEHLEVALREAGVVEGEIRKIAGVLGQRTQPSLNEIQCLFAVECASLYLLQTVHHQISVSSRTLLLVKKLLTLFESVMNKFEQAQALDGVVVFPMAMLTLGISLVGKANRESYQKKIERLYLLTKKENLITMLTFLERVWYLDPTGTSYIDTRQLAAQDGITIFVQA